MGNYDEIVNRKRHSLLPIFLWGVSHESFSFNPPLLHLQCTFFVSLSLSSFLLALTQKAKGRRRERERKHGVRYEMDGVKLRRVIRSIFYPQDRERNHCCCSTIYWKTNEYCASRKIWDNDLVHCHLKPCVKRDSFKGGWAQNLPGQRHTLVSHAAAGCLIQHST